MPVGASVRAASCHAKHKEKRAGAPLAQHGSCHAKHKHNVLHAMRVSNNHACDSGGRHPTGATCTPRRNAFDAPRTPHVNHAHERGLQTAIAKGARPRPRPNVPGCAR
eukprot:992896-Alexandrium_andersonii.AAC.1